MNISQYKNSMDEITAKSYEIEELIKRREQNRKTVILKITGCLICILIINMVWLYVSPGNTPKVTITAMAAEKEIALTKEFVDFTLELLPLIGEVEEDSDSYVNCNIYFKCEGQDIADITYQCSDQQVTRYNRKSAAAYYVENMIIPRNEYDKYLKVEGFLYGYYVPEEETANITRIIGNSYCVNYENQNDIQYGIVIAARKDAAESLVIKDTIVNVKIQFKDGTVQHKKIMIKHGENSFDIQVRVL